MRESCGNSGRSLRKEGHRNAVLERELQDITAWSYRSRVTERIVLERELRDLAAGRYRSRGTERAVMESGLRGGAVVGTPRRRVRIEGQMFLWKSNSPTLKRWGQKRRVCLNDRFLFVVVQ